MEFENPGVTADIIIEKEEKILLVKRKNEPFKGKWALPGGFLDFGKETIEETAARELLEETGLTLITSELLGVYSKPNRDPRRHIVSLVYVGKEYDGIAKAGDDAEELYFFPLDSLPELAFDHARVLNDYKAWRKKMKFKNILIVYTDRPSEKHMDVVEKVIKLVGKCSIAQSRRLKEEYFKNKDLIISIGGDGTFIRATHFIKDQLILGINSEPSYSEGGLMSLKDNELDVLKEILNGKYNVIKRERVHAKINGKKINEHAVNEIYIGTANQFHTSRYIINYKGKKEEQRSSGVIVCSGSGSNAWYKSAGGTPFEYTFKKLKFLVREPFMGNIFKSTILKGEINKGEKISFESRGYYGGAIAIDSNKMYEFKMGDIVEVFSSDQPLNIIVRK